MYRLWRDLHLAMGLAAALGLFVYALSSLQMGHSFAFKWLMKDQWNKVTIPVAATDFSQPRKLASSLTEQGVRGNLVEVTTSSLAVKLTFKRPGTMTYANIVAGASVAEVATRSRGPLWTINRLHHLAGLAHEDSRQNAWGYFVLFCSFSLIGLGASGIAMWWMRAKERRLGMMLFVPATVIGTVLLTWIRL